MREADQCHGCSDCGAPSQTAGHKEERIVRLPGEVQDQDQGGGPCQRDAVVVGQYVQRPAKKWCFHRERMRSRCSRRAVAVKAFLSEHQPGSCDVLLGRLSQPFSTFPCCNLVMSCVSPLCIDVVHCALESSTTWVSLCDNSHDSLRK